MKRIIILLFCIITFISCTNKSMDGIYSYKEAKSEDPILGFGKSLGCSMVGKIELKDGFCYLNFLGTENRVKFIIEEDKIILNSVNGNEIILNIIDSNTINFNGCNFVKSEDESDNKISEPIKKEVKPNDRNVKQISSNKLSSSEEIKPFNQKSKIFNDFDGCGYFFAKDKKELDKNNLIFAGFLYDEPSPNQERYIKLVLDGRIEKLKLISSEKDKQYNFENKDYQGQLIIDSTYEGENRTQVFKGEIKIFEKKIGKIYFCKVYGESVC